MSAAYLSKSNYLTFRKHPTWLWLKKHDPKRLPPLTEADRAVMESGRKFEPYAETHFPGGVRVDTSFDHAALATKKLLDDGAETILQGQFCTGDLLCISDVLIRNPDGSFDLVEIKGSASAKTEHEWDLAFQKIVLERLGFQIRKCQVAHLNPKYVRHGDIDAESLAVLTDLTDKVAKRLKKTEAELVDALKVLALPHCPSDSPRHATACFGDWREVFMYLHPELPELSIYRLCGLNAKLTAKLEDLGVSEITDIDEKEASLKLNDKQVACIQSLRDEEPIVDHGLLGAFLDQFTYPIYFYDYETASAMLPLFDGMTPYSQIPIQYSLHVLHEDGRLEHKEFLRQEPTDPAEALLAQLSTDIGETGSVVSWNMGFEKGMNEALAQRLPNYAPFLNELNARTIDLMEPFKDYYLDGACLGSASIKAVLPVLVPHLSHKELEIGDGSTAQCEWMRVTLGEGSDDAERVGVYESLLRYCELDTLAMVRIFQVLVHRCEGGTKRHPDVPITNDVELGEIWLETADMSDSERRAIGKEIDARIAAVQGS